MWSFSIVISVITIKSKTKTIIINTIKTIIKTISESTPPFINYFTLSLNKFIKLF